MTRFWTATELPSENCRSSALARWPLSGPKTSCRAGESSCSETSRARSPNAALDLARGLLELGLDELGVGAGLLAVEHAGADLDRVVDQGDRVVAGFLAFAHEADRGLVVDDQAVDGEVLADGADVGLSQGVAASMTVRRRVGAGPDGQAPSTLCRSARLKPGQQAGLLVRHRLGRGLALAQQELQRALDRKTLAQRNHARRDGGGSLPAGAAVQVDACRPSSSASNTSVTARSSAGAGRSP